jgi:putative aminopeptidase FrvX
MDSSCRPLKPFRKTVCTTFVGIAILLSAVPFAAQFHFSVVKREVVLDRLRSCPAKDTLREQQLQSYFTAAGCGPPALALELPEHSDLGNVVCTLKGTSMRTIVVGAHFDHVPQGAGAVDNWSGASLLPSLYQAVSTEPRKHTFVFVAFYGEEQGLVGSEHYVHALSREQRAEIDAMVNMDTLGLGPTEVWVSHADPKLAKIAFGVANAMKLPLSGVNVERIGSTDSESFRDKRVPSICFHSLTQLTMPILHSQKDQLSAIKEDDYYNSYKLISAYLSYLDNIESEPLK